MATNERVPSTAHPPRPTNEETPGPTETQQRNDQPAEDWGQRQETGEAIARGGKSSGPSANERQHKDAEGR